MTKLYMLLALFIYQANLAMQPAHTIRRGLYHLSKRAFLTKQEKECLDDLIAKQERTKFRLKIAESPLAPTLGVTWSAAVPIWLILQSNGMESLCISAIGGIICAHYLNKAIEELNSNLIHDTKYKL